MEYSNSGMENLINEYIHKDRDKEIMRLRLIHGMTYEAIAEAVGMSNRQIYRIVSRDAAKLYRYLKSPESIPPNHF